MPTTIANYQVADTDPITVDVFVGDAQPGGSTVSLGIQEKGRGGDTLVAVDMGSGADVRGKKMIVTTVVQNKNPNTNRTSQRLVLRGAAEAKDITQSQIATAKDELVSFVVVVSFV